MLLSTYSWWKDGGGWRAHYSISWATCALNLWLNSNHPSAFMRAAREILIIAWDPRLIFSAPLLFFSYRESEWKGEEESSKSWWEATNWATGKANSETKLWLVTYWSYGQSNVCAAAEINYYALANARVWTSLTSCIIAHNLWLTLHPSHLPPFHLTGPASCLS